MRRTEGTAFVLACSAKKAPELAGARGGMWAKDAYAGGLFRIARAELEAAGASWCILSGRYGFLSPEARVEWYEQRIGEPRSARHWPDAFQGLRGDPTGGGLKCCRRVVVIGGRSYAAAASALLSRWVECPLEGLPVGRMLQAAKGLVDRELARDLPDVQPDLLACGLSLAPGARRMPVEKNLTAG